MDPIEAKQFYAIASNQTVFFFSSWLFSLFYQETVGRKEAPEWPEGKHKKAGELVRDEFDRRMWRILWDAKSLIDMETSDQSIPALQFLSRLFRFTRTVTNSTNGQPVITCPSPELFN